jgi:hypothetical protein
VADQRIEPAGCLGRVLTLLGIVWLGVVVFTGVFGLRDQAGSLGALIGSTLPGLLLIGVGRTLSRRAAERRDTPTLPQPSEPATGSSTSKEVPTPAPPVPPPSRPTEVFPKPARTTPPPAPEADVPSDLPPPPAPPPPKSSQEMIEEARKRWGRRPPIP